ncbi:uncharacterized protein CDV56_102029 [Aspergillus thermomutatus]|uniref:Major facilitator superfamily (MFS) profile domain-containing protein n=1 Tax=Aspergillus thermomutatus TaxID=41047 RepID=A0A397G562_ASPTH|nr:uncharacterized protein CDV56_102029 [Aspergillus thermomutatus]RHZ45199.1 hypothetical protein CDV56_102029 [Aspergillus thermomutatus]
MWAMTMLAFILVPLRLYTRIVVLRALGLDDHVYNLGWVFLLLYTVFLTIANRHGFGQPISTLSMDEAVHTVYMEMIGQTFAVLGMAIAKLSLGIFLLRIVVKTWHRVSIWASMVSLSIVSVLTAVVFWIQRLPSRSIYDPRVPGRTVVHIVPFSVLLGSWCAAVDFYFAILPWIFIWNLNMKQKEKLIIAISLSLGFIAGICGVIRTIDLGGLSSANYTEDTVDLIIWSAVELAATLICVGIPTVRPLYRHIVHGSRFKESNEGYRKQDESGESNPGVRMKHLGNQARKGEIATTTSTVLGNTVFDVPRGDTSLYVQHVREADEEMLVASHREQNRPVHRLNQKIMKNHAYQDGNKRTALLAADMFLKINGYRLQKVPFADDPFNKALADAHVAVVTNKWTVEQLGNFYHTVDNATPVHASAESPHLTTATIAWTMMSLCLSVLLSALDLTIVTPAIPAIAGTFKTAAGYIWVGSAYTLAYAAITPVWGSVSDIWGRKPIMLIAVAVFLVGSLICALAPHMDALIVGRAIQGLGGSGMGIMVNIVVSDMFSLRDRGLYLAITSLVWAVGSAIGPVLGGVFTTRLSWRWCFWINLPVGAVSFLVLLFFMRVPSPRTPIAAGLKVIDWTGSLLIVGGSLMILLALDFGDVVYSWSSATVICLLVFGTAVMALFVVNEWKIAKNPIIPVWLFTSPTKIAPYVVFACNSYVFIGQAYYLPLYAQSVLAASALTSGLYLLPLIVSCSLAAAAAGIFMQQTGKYLPVMYIAQGFLVLGSGLLISLDFESNITKLIIFQILVGIGVGMNIEAPILAAQAATSVRDTAAVTATMGFVRSLSTAISVVVGGVVFQNEMNAKNEGLASQLGSNSTLAREFNGDLAASSVEEISTLGLNADQEVLVRKTYFEALRMVWIMCIYANAHKLRSENEGAVLGADRSWQSPANGVAELELRNERGD